MKLLWYADSIFFGRHGKSMTGLVYKHMPLGALPLQEGIKDERVTAKRFIGVFQRTKLIESFDTDLYFKVVEKITTYEDRLVVSLLDGTEIECEIE